MLINVVANSQKKLILLTFRTIKKLFTNSLVLKHNKLYLISKIQPASTRLSRSKQLTFRVQYFFFSIIYFSQTKFVIINVNLFIQYITVVRTFEIILANVSTTTLPLDFTRTTISHGSLGKQKAFIFISIAIYRRDRCVLTYYLS